MFLMQVPCQIFSLSVFFSHSVDYLFFLLVVTLEAQFLIFMKSYLSNFSLGVICKKPFPK